MLYDAYECSFQALFTCSDSFCIVVSNLQKLMTEIDKSVAHLVWELHEKRHITCNRRIRTGFGKLGLSSI